MKTFITVLLMPAGGLLAFNLYAAEPMPQHDSVSSVECAELDSNINRSRMRRDDVDIQNLKSKCQSGHSDRIMDINTSVAIDDEDYTDR